LLSWSTMYLLKKQIKEGLLTGDEHSTWSETAP
jgi:hypothetical protein